MAEKTERIIPLLRQVSIYIKIENEVDLKKLIVQTTLDSVEYEPESKLITAIATISLEYPESIYTYGGSSIRGTARTYESCKITVKDPEKIGRIKDAIGSAALLEFNEIKKEIEALLRYSGKVTVNLNDVMNRIAKKALPEASD